MRLLDEMEQEKDKTMHGGIRFIGLNQAEYMQPLFDTRVLQKQQLKMLGRSPFQIKHSFFTKLGIPPPSPSLSQQQALDRRSSPLGYPRPWEREDEDGSGNNSTLTLLTTSPYHTAQQQKSRFYQGATSPQMGYSRLPTGMSPRRAKRFYESTDESGGTSKERGEGEEEGRGSNTFQGGSGGSGRVPRRSRRQGNSSQRLEGERVPFSERQQLLEQQGGGEEGKGEWDQNESTALLGAGREGGKKKGSKRRHG